MPCGLPVEMTRSMAPPWVSFVRRYVAWPGLPIVPRLLPLATAVMLALAGVKSFGLMRQALAGSSPAASPPAKSAPAPASSSSRPAPAAAAGAPAPSLAGDPQPEVIAPPTPAQMAAPPVSEAERGILLDLRKRRTELEAREAAISSREGLLSAAEKRLVARADELTDLQRRLELLEKARTERDDESWRSLVKLYETMKPRDAAVIFNDLDRPVLLAVLDRMKEAKAAPVLAAMQPERARQITAELAQRRTLANRPADPPPPRQSGG